MPAKSHQKSLPVIKKEGFPVSSARKYLEPGPVVLVSSHHAGRNNVMTLGWHCILAFSPSLIGLMISSGNHSHRMIRESGVCVVNIPTVPLADIVAGIGNCTGSDLDKFEQFALTPQKAEKIDAPLIGECHASFECRLHDDAMIDAYDYFVFEIVAAHVAPDPEYPETLHYTGDGIFTLSGKSLDKSALFTKVS